MATAEPWTFPSGELWDTACVSLLFSSVLGADGLCLVAEFEDIY